jgi:predicted transcriptional regulator
MSKELASVKENQQVADLVNLMSEKRVRRVLVQNDQGQFNGIVSLADLACKLEDKELLYKVTRGISEQSA